MTSTNRVRIQCPACGQSRRGDLEDILRAAGHLRRQKEPDADMMWELLKGMLPSWNCHKCGEASLKAAPEEWEDEGDGWLEVKRCQRCKEPIPSERLELFPDEVYCAACRTARDSSPQDVTYCGRCGSPTELRARNAGGTTRYVEYCPSCSAR